MGQALARGQPVVAGKTLGLVGTGAAGDERGAQPAPPGRCCSRRRVEAAERAATHQRRLLQGRLVGRQVGAQAELIDELGLRADLAAYEPPLQQAALVRGGALSRFDPAPRAASAWRGGLSAALIPRRPRPYEPESFSGDHRLTAGERLAHAGGEGLAAAWAGPLLAWAWGCRPGDVSAGMLGHLAGLASRKAWTLRGGIGALPRQLASRLHVATEVRVTRIATREGRAGVSFMCDGRQEEREADAVVIAVPGTLVRGLLNAVPAAWAPLLERVAYAMGLAVYLVLEVGDGLELQPPCRLFAASEGNALVGLAAIAHSTHRRRLLVQAVPNDAAELFACREDDIYALVESTMAAVWPEMAAGRVLARWLFRWANQAPCWRPGYLEALRAARAHLREGPLYLTGDYLAGPGAGAALADGWACAEQVLRQAA